MHVFRVSKYASEHFGERGYEGPEPPRSDHGPVEAAYLASVEAFATDTGVTELTIREPEVGGAKVGWVDGIAGHGLIGLFPADLSGYHDGAWVSLATGVALVRAMLRDNGAWCRLEVDERFFIHIGHDQDMYVGSSEACDDALARVHSLGLFAERIDRSPWDPHLHELEVPRPADDDFWAEVERLVDEGGRVVLEECYIGNAARWHYPEPGQVAGDPCRSHPARPAVGGARDVHTRVQLRVAARSRATR